jgi:uncharacterized membrane protein YjgN (DUF898 family)
MEQEQQGLFGLNLDSAIKTHLYETAKWGRFLAIVGFVMCAIIVIAGIAFMANYDDSAYSSYRRYNEPSTQGLGAAGLIAYIIVAVLYFFPALFLFRFSNQMKTALMADDQSTLTTSFQNLKVLFRYMGVLMIIFLAIFVLGMLAGLGSSR